MACPLQETSPETKVAMTVLAAYSDHVVVAAKLARNVYVRTRHRQSPGAEPPHLLPLQLPSRLGEVSLRASAGSAVPRPVYLGSSNLEVQTRLHDQFVPTRPQGSRSAAAAPRLEATPQRPSGTSSGYHLGCRRHLGGCRHWAAAAVPRSVRPYTRNCSVGGEVIHALRDVHGLTQRLCRFLFGLIGGASRQLGQSARPILAWSRARPCHTEPVPVRRHRLDQARRSSPGDHLRCGMPPGGPASAKDPRCPELSPVPLG